MSFQSFEHTEEHTEEQQNLLEEWAEKHDLKTEKMPSAISMLKMSRNSLEDGKFMEK